MIESSNMINDREKCMPFGNFLTEDQIGLMAENSNTVKYHRKDVIFKQNTRTSHIMFVKSGLVKIFKEDKNDKSIILRLAIPGYFIGLMSVYGSTIHEYSATAIEDTEICFIDINIFNQIISINGNYAINLVRIISQEGLFIFKRLMSQTHKQLPGRIADVILYFSEDIYKSDEFEFPFTRKELAQLAGTTKESFIRTLSEFKHDKIIDLEGSRVKILSLKIINTLRELG
ncbi:MAG: Crp/Fnr family transcriptional regulator [Bacteroidales bacterium]|nr:Crp/Fnr family transcriptional regulator [Bacteroidales bacterium]